MEDSMKIYGRKMIMEKTASQRFIADSVFIRMLVRSLKTPYSFNYPFDSLQTVSNIYAPDSTFRIFSWQFTRDDDYYRQRGAIQMKTADGSLKLFPLLDMSDFTKAPQDSIRTGQNWIGAIYYGIVMKTFNNKKYYTLLGFDDNNMRSTKKWIEVLTFNENGKPVFGGPYFTVLKDSLNASTTPARYCMEYKKQGNARMNYDKDMDMIVYDHLVSESNEPSKAYTLIPDGDYQGFKWDNGKWIQIDKIFNYKLNDGQAPVPAPLKDATGKSNESKLMQQSEKNRESQRPSRPQSPSNKQRKQDEESY
ncbi:hypothetical protein [Segetibacter koreensis]|uniref:hypothetical protein n=1 Tax=Segetibacter koreensis TaxID=398037 RepID=UPI0012F7D42B|nr:hypothetical protein [Segetibacter koreensis]